MARYYRCDKMCQGDRMLTEEEVWHEPEVFVFCKHCHGPAREELAGEATPDDIEIARAADQCPLHSGYDAASCPMCEQRKEKKQNMDIDLYFPLDSEQDFQLLENGNRVGSMKLHGVEHRILVVPTKHEEPGCINHKGRYYLINIFATVRRDL